MISKGNHHLMSIRDVIQNQNLEEKVKRDVCNYLLLHAEEQCVWVEEPVKLVGRELKTWVNEMMLWSVCFVGMLKIIAWIVFEYIWMIWMFENALQVVDLWCNRKIQIASIFFGERCWPGCNVGAMADDDLSLSKRCRCGWGPRSLAGICM